MPDKFADRFPSSITATKLYERTSAKGNPYLIGRWGSLRVAVLKTQDTDDEGNAIWEMRLSAAPAVVRQTSARNDVSSSTRELTYTAVDPDDTELPSPRLHARSGSGFATPAFTEDEIPY